MNRPRRTSFALATIFACFASGLVAHAITITSNSVLSTSVSTSGSTSGTFSGTGIPSSQLVDATTGAYFSRTQVDYTGSGNQVSLLNTFDQSRTGVVGKYASSEGQMVFSADANVSYSLSGAFSDVDVTSAGFLYFESFLQDLTSSTTLVDSVQRSAHTLNESFVLGGSGGDNYNAFLGSLTGSLVAGHQYRWYFYSLTEAYPDADGGATAAGYVRLDIGGGAPAAGVPDGASTLGLLGAAFLGFGLIRRKIGA